MEAPISAPHAEVASHGQYHPAYAHIAKSDELFDMLCDRRDLEALFGKLIRGHAYPYASFNEDVMEMMRLSGFAYAGSVDSCYDFRLPYEDEWLRIIQGTYIETFSKSTKLKFITINLYYAFFGMIPCRFYISQRKNLVI